MSMRKISALDNLSKLQDYFNKLGEYKFSVLLWQMDKDQSRRKVVRAELSAHEEQAKKLRLIGQDTFNFKDPMVYVYIEAFQSIFKAEALEQDNMNIALNYPLEMKFLEPEFRNLIQNAFQKIDPALVSGTTEITYQSDADIFQAELDEFLSPDDEDKMFADKRSAPRARPKKTKMVTASIDGSDDIKIYELFDLSQGGMSFLCLEENFFEKGNNVLIHAFDEKNFESPMVSEVMSVRPADELGVQFKIGLKFVG